MKSPNIQSFFIYAVIVIGIVIRVNARSENAKFAIKQFAQLFFNSCLLNNTKRTRPLPNLNNQNINLT